YNTDAACKSTHVRVSGSKGKLKLATTKSGSPDARLARDGLKGPISRGYTEEIEHWAWAILEKAKLAAAAPAADDGAEAKPAGPSKPTEIAVPLRCSPKVALADAVIALTANLAIAQGKATEQNARIDFAPEWFDIDSDETPEGEPPNVHRPEYQT
ncbi:MAG: hypothetical protein VX257_07755, partial [Planctomycetota bacterium]|nr:hypothetical protein [Planctomycetota bacterium]